jgi:hypothetical protein
MYVKIETLTEDKINSLIDEKLLSSVDGINSMIGNSLTLLFGAFTIYLIFTGISFFHRKKIVEEVMLEVRKELNTEIRSVEDNINLKFNKHIKNSIKKFKDESQEEEYVRNLIFKDLSSMLADEIRGNGDHNLSDVFNWYAERLYIIIQLTSGNEREVRRSLKKLSTGSYNMILTLKSFQKYIELLDKNIDMDISIDLEKLKNTMKLQNRKV